jgi:uncharacterized DUF497 family protein
MAEEFAELFARVRDFGWDPAKVDWTIRERGIDFDEVRFIFDGPTIVYRSDRKGEARYVVFGFLDGRGSRHRLYVPKRLVLGHIGPTSE